jgi:hypothetical protein
MHLDRCIATNRRCVAICLNIYQIINGILLCALLLCVFRKILSLWLIGYLSVIKELYDIVPRAVNVYRDKLPPPQLEQINTIIKHNTVSLFDNVSNTGNIMIAVISQNANCAMHFLLCGNIGSGVAYE